MLSTSFWNKYFEVYDYLNILIPYDELLNVVVKELNAKKGDIVFDAGSGTGNLAIRLKAAGLVVVAMDSSPEGVERHKNKKLGDRVVLGDLTLRLPFGDNYFDGICSNNVIYTLPDDKRLHVFKEFFRVLKPGGRVIVSNIATNFKPILIYKEHIYKSLKKTGLIRTFFSMIRLIVPTIRLFYYNYLIRKSNISGGNRFMGDNEQREFLLKVGFVNVSIDKHVYTGQAILNSATKK